MLSLLIESKIKLPRCAPAPNRSAKRELLKAQGERDFFLGIVRDVATDLDLKSLSQKTVDNLAVLLDADGASLFLVDGPRGGRQTLVSKVKTFLLYRVVREQVRTFVLCSASSVTIASTFKHICQRHKIL
jgi:hypothetical protein